MPPFYLFPFGLKSSERLIDFPRIVNKSPNLDDLRVLSLVVRLTSFSAAAEQLARELDAALDTLARMLGITREPRPV